MRNRPSDRLAPFLLDPPAMSAADLSIRRPVFVTAIVILLLALGYLAVRRLAVDLFPDVTFPIVTVNTPYPGAGPQEVETLVSRPLEDEMGTLPGIKNLRSENREGLSVVIAEFTLETNIQYAEQLVRDRVGSARRQLPQDIEEPVIRRVDPSDQPILIISLAADVNDARLFDLADKSARPQIEQVAQVGRVDVVGGREREIRVELDRAKLVAYDVSATQVANRISQAGQNIPAGEVTRGATQTVFRTLGEFSSLRSIGDVIVNFLGNDVPVQVRDLGRVVDTVEDERSRGFVNGRRAVFLLVYRQTGSNTIAVVDAVRARVDELNRRFASGEGQGGARLDIVRDASKNIRSNVLDVYEAILVGIALTVIVVYFFLGSGRSTFITGLAIPNSLIGAFFLMSVAGFSINVMSLLALSLAVGLLIDDAIVVRENIFRHNEMGKAPRQAAIDGTREVALAVVAVTLAVLAVFGPIGFLRGVVGQFFKEFGLTVCFAMLISLFDALTMAPMLSAYFAGGTHGVARDRKSFWGRTMGAAVRGFDRFQNGLAERYGRVLGWTLRWPKATFLLAGALFAGSLALIPILPKTFLPAQDFGEFQVRIELPPGTSIPKMTAVAAEVEKRLRSNPEIESSVLIVGGEQTGSNRAQFFVNLVPSARRAANTTQLKDRVRQQLGREFSYANPIVSDIDVVGGGQRPFNVNISGTDLAELERVATQVFERLRKHPGLKDVELGHRPGAPEFQVQPDPVRAERLGVNTSLIGQEIRTQIEGATPAVFRERGEEYDIRVRLMEGQRDLRKGFAQTRVPNVNGQLVRLANVARPRETTGPSIIYRQNRARYIQISGDVAPEGPGMGGVISDTRRLLEREIKLPPGMSYDFVGQAENFEELLTNMIVAAGLGVLFIYLVLASLYESFVTPLAIMLVLPLAACGAFAALWATGKSLDLFSMIGCVMLFGIASKNSILLVDFSNHLVGRGVDLYRAVEEAGRVRLRPILMTSIALIAGMLPIAIGLSETSRQRTSMGVAVIGGLVSSTLLTLVVVPVAFTYIERFRRWSGGRVKRLVAPKDAPVESSKPETRKSA